MVLDDGSGARGTNAGGQTSNDPWVAASPAAIPPPSDSAPCPLLAPLVTHSHTAPTPADCPVPVGCHLNCALSAGAAFALSAWAQAAPSAGTGVATAGGWGLHCLHVGCTQPLANRYANPHGR